MKLYALVFSVPLAVWALSYAYLAFFHKEWNLLNVRVHESGRKTLLEAIFYFNHFLRELFIDTFFVLCIFWSYRAVGHDIFYADLAKHSNLILGTFVSFVLLVFVGSIRKVGLKNTLLDLFQVREVDEVVEYGSHWQMHFLSTLTLMLIFVLPATFFKGQSFSGILIIFILFLALSLLFRTGIRAVTDRRWLLHGGREIATLLSLTAVPAFVPLVPLLWRKPSQQTLLTTIVIALIVGIMTYYLWILLRTDVRQASRAREDFSVPYLFFSHFFEHMLDFCYMLLLMLVLIALVG